MKQQSADSVSTSFLRLLDQFQKGVEEESLMVEVTGALKYRDEVFVKKCIQKFLFDPQDRSVENEKLRWLFHLNFVQFPLTMISKSTPFKLFVIQKIEQQGETPFDTNHGYIFWAFFDALLSSKEHRIVKLYNNISSKYILQLRKCDLDQSGRSTSATRISYMLRLMERAASKQVANRVNLAMLLASAIKVCPAKMTLLRVVQRLAILALQDTQWTNFINTLNHLALLFASNPRSIWTNTRSQELPFFVIMHLKPCQRNRLLLYCEQNALHLVRTRLGREFLLLTTEVCRNARKSADIFRVLLNSYDVLWRLEVYQRTLWYLADYMCVEDRHDYQTWHRLRLSHHLGKQDFDIYMHKLRSFVAKDVKNLYDIHHCSWEKGIRTGRVSKVFQRTILSLTLNFIGPIARLESDLIQSVAPKNQGQENLSFSRVRDKYQAITSIQIFDLRHIVVTIRRLGPSNGNEFTYLPREKIVVSSRNFEVRFGVKTLVIPLHIKYDAIDSEHPTHHCVLLLNITRGLSDIEVYLLDGYRCERGRQFLFPNIIRNHVVTHLEQKLSHIIGSRRLRLKRNPLGDYYMLPFNGTCFLLTCWIVNEICKNMADGTGYCIMDLRLPSHLCGIAEEIRQVESEFMEFDDALAKKFKGMPDPSDIIARFVEEPCEKIECILSHRKKSGWFCETPHPEQNIDGEHTCDCYYDFLVKFQGERTSRSRWMCENRVLLFESRDTFQTLIEKYVNLSLDKYTEQY